MVARTLAGSTRGPAAHSADSSNQALGAIMLQYIDSDRNVALRNFLADAATEISAMHIPGFAPPKDDGHLDCFTVDIASEENSSAFDGILSNSARRDRWLETKVSEIFSKTSSNHNPECRACGILRKFICFIWSKYADTASLPSRELETLGDELEASGLFDFDVPDAPWVSMPVIIDDRSTDNAVYIGYKLSGDVDFDAAKAATYRTLGTAWIQSPNTTDAELEEMDNAAYAYAAASASSSGGAPDLID